MKKSYNHFLLISFIISYTCFGIIVYSKVSFNHLFNDLLYLSLFVLGFLGPLISSFVVHIINKDTLGGTRGFMDKLIKIKASKSIVLIPVFLFAHYALAILLKNVDRYGSIKDFIYFLPIMLIILGSQEIGWRGIVQTALEEKKGFWKSSVITGLFWALWFLPLIFIPDFIIIPQFYSQFAAYLVGISLMLSALYKASGSILYCIILSSLIFSLSPVIDLKQGFMLVGIAVLEAILTSLFKDKNFI